MHKKQIDNLSNKDIPKFIRVKLTPKASSDRIVIPAVSGEICPEPQPLQIYVTEAPEDGKANRAMLKLLAKHYGVPASRLELVAGGKSRDKVVRIKT